MEIWTEKYRPQTFDQVAGQEIIVERVQALTKEKNIPNLLFAGPAGVGKSTIALVMAKALYGENMKDNLLELNASDERGIDVVRGVIKDFSRTKAMKEAPFKIIFLDECDSLTKEAQQALRRTMENFTQNVRFILSCNFSTKIIDPIQSRCTVFRFKPLEKEQLQKIIQAIVKNENLSLDQKAIDALCNVSEGDGRKLSNILQSTAALNEIISEELIYKITNSIKPKEIKEILMLSLQGEFLKSREKLLDTMLKHSLSGIDIIKQIQKEILTLETNEKNKAKLIELCGEIEFRLVEGSDEFIQLESLLASFNLIGK